VLFSSMTAAPILTGEIVATNLSAKMATAIKTSLKGRSIRQMCRKQIITMRREYSERELSLDLRRDRIARNPMQVRTRRLHPSPGSHL